MNSDQPSQESLVNTPPVWGRRLVSMGIVVFLLTQVAIPASYYIGHDEPTSERFAWRMFSSIDLSRWSCVFRERVETGRDEIEREIPIERFLQETSCVSIRAAQLDVVSKFMRLRLQQPGVQSVQFEAHGTAPSGRSLGTIRLMADRANGVVRQIGS